MKRIMKLQIFIVVAYMLYLPNNVECQNDDKDRLSTSFSNYLKNSSSYHLINCNTDSIRHLYIYSSVGLFEYFSIGVGYQLSPRFAISLKHASTWVSGHGGSHFFPPYGSGLGFNLQYFMDLWVFNNVSFNYIYYMYVPNIYDNTYGIKPKGNYYEINFGNERTKKGVKGKLQLFWSVGVGKSFNKNYGKTLIMPSIKIGVYHNLF